MAIYLDEALTSLPYVGLWSFRAWRALLWGPCQLFIAGPYQNRGKLVRTLQGPYQNFCTIVTRLEKILPRISHLFKLEIHKVRIQANGKLKARFDDVKGQLRADGMIKPLAVKLVPTETQSFVFPGKKRYIYILKLFELSENNNCRYTYLYIFKRLNLSIYFFFHNENIFWKNCENTVHVLKFYSIIH